MCSGLDAIQVVIYKDNWTASSIHVVYPPVAVIGSPDWMNVFYSTAHVLEPMQMVLLLLLKKKKNKSRMGRKMIEGKSRT